jgi:hemoglobin
MSGTLYERLGGETGISAIARDIIDNHMKNPKIKVRFQDVDSDQLHRYVVEFFGMGSGGPQKYTGRDMKEAHRSLNINEEEFLAVVDDVMGALDKNDITGDTRNEVLGILYSLKGDIIRL